MEEGKGERYLASGRQYGNAPLGVHHQEEEDLAVCSLSVCLSVYKFISRQFSSAAILYILMILWAIQSAITATAQLLVHFEMQL